MCAANGRALRTQDFLEAIISAHPEATESHTHMIITCPHGEHSLSKRDIREKKEGSKHVFCIRRLHMLI